eukprot:1159972-Pelagomonas_calceolata.AAC.18
MGLLPNLSPSSLKPHLSCKGGWQVGLVDDHASRVVVLWWREGLLEGASWKAYESLDSLYCYALLHSAAQVCTSEGKKATLLNWNAVWDCKQAERTACLAQAAHAASSMWHALETHNFHLDAFEYTKSPPSSSEPHASGWVWVPQNTTMLQQATCILMGLGTPSHPQAAASHMHFDGFGYAKSSPSCSKQHALGWVQVCQATTEKQQATHTLIGLGTASHHQAAANNTHFSSLVTRFGTPRHHQEAASHFDGFGYANSLPSCSKHALGWVWVSQVTAEQQQLRPGQRHVHVVLRGFSSRDSTTTLSGHHAVRPQDAAAADGPQTALGEGRRILEWQLGIGEGPAPSTGGLQGHLPPHTWSRNRGLGIIEAAGWKALKSACMVFAA